MKMALFDHASGLLFLIASTGLHTSAYGQTPQVTVSFKSLSTLSTTSTLCTGRGPTLPANTTFTAVNLGPCRLPYGVVYTCGRIGTVLVEAKSELFMAWGGVTGTAGPNRVLATLKSNIPVRVRLRISASSMRSGMYAASIADGWVDLGSTGKKDFRFNFPHSIGGATQVTPVIALDSKGYDIEFSTSFRASYGGPLVSAARNFLVIELLPSRCTVQTRGVPSCSAAVPVTIGMEKLDSELVVRHFFARQGQTGVVGIGVNRIDVPLPGSVCRLYTDVPILLFYKTKPNIMTLRYPVPVVNAPVAFNVQVFLPSASRIQSSAASYFDCK